MKFVAMGLLGLALSLPVQAVYEMDPILVTAARIPTDISSMSSDVVVWDEPTLKASTAISLTELLANTAGVEFTSTGNSSLFVRGTNFNHLVVLVDGLRINSATTGAAAIGNIPVSELAKVELLKGPNALYGMDAVGGVLALYTKKGSRSISTTLGSEYQGVNLSLSSEAGSWGNSLSFHQSKTNLGSVTSPNIPWGMYHPDDDRIDQRGLAVSTSYKNGTHQLSASLRSDETVAAYDDGFSADPKSKQRNSQFSIQHQWDAAGVQWKSQLGVAEDHYTTTNGAMFETRNWQAQTVRSQVKRLYQWGIGLDLLHQEVSSDTSFTESTRDVTGLFVNGTYKLGNWQSTGTLRMDNNSQFGTEPTGAVSLSYSPDSQWKMWAGTGVSFKAPSFNDMYWPLMSFGTTTYSGNPNLKPERAKNHELGVQWRFQNYTSKWVIFKNSIDDLIQGSQGWVTNDFPVNVASARIQGLEWAQAFNSGAWGADLALTWQDATNQTTGKDLTRRASFYGKGTLSYKSGLGVSSLTVNHQGSRYDDPSNSSLLPAYTTLDLAHKWSSGNHELTAKVANINNREYEYTLGYPAPERNYSITYQFTF